MKKVLIACGLALFMAAPVMAGNTIEKNPVNVESLTLDQDKNKKDKEEVKVSELPASVLTAMNGREYAGWEATKAWKVKKEDTDTWYYKVEMKKGDETKKVKFSEDGKAMVS